MKLVYKILYDFFKMWGVSFIGELKPILLNSVVKYFSQLQSTIIL